jgi:hypothetical protein
MAIISPPSAKALLTRSYQAAGGRVQAMQTNKTGGKPQVERKPATARLHLLVPALYSLAVVLLSVVNEETASVSLPHIVGQGRQVGGQWMGGWNGMVVAYFSSPTKDLLLQRGAINTMFQCPPDPGIIKRRLIHAQGQIVVASARGLHHGNGGIRL